MTTLHNVSLGAWQRRFLMVLFQVVIRMRGRVNFANMARYSDYCEQTFHRHFRKAFWWVALNLTILRLRRHPSEPLIGVFDCTFLPKSGTETWGLGRFFSSQAGRSKRGLEVSFLGVVATGSRRAFGVDATQTPSDLSTSQETSQVSSYTRVDFYLEQMIDLYTTGLPIWACPTGSEAASTRNGRSSMRQAGFGGELITRLRSESDLMGSPNNLRYLYTGPRKKGPGAPKRCDGKISVGCSSRTYRRWAQNRFLTRRLFSELGLGGEWILFDREVQPILETGMMTS